MFKRYVIKRVTKLSSLVKAIQEGGGSPEESDILVAVLERDEPRKPEEIDIIYGQELGGDTLLINKRR